MTFVLIPGAGSGAWTWHLVVAELERRGHEAVAVDLPCDDDSAGLSEYVDVAMAAAARRSDLDVAAQSLGAFTRHAAVRPRPGRSAGPGERDGARPRRVAGRLVGQHRLGRGPAGGDRAPRRR